MFCYSYVRFKLVCVLLPLFLPYSSHWATARLQFVRFLHLSTPPHRQELSSQPPVGGSCGICRETLVPELIVVLPCDHVFHHSCVDDVRRFERYRAALSARVTVDCMTSLYFLASTTSTSECRPLPRQVRAVRPGDGFVEDANGSLEPWHMFARRQHV